MDPEVNFKSVSASIDRLCLKHVMEENQVLPNEMKTNLKVDLQMTGHKKGMEKDVTLDIPKKLADILISERNIHTAKRMI